MGSRREGPSRRRLLALAAGGLGVSATAGGLMTARILFGWWNPVKYPPSGIEQVRFEKNVDSVWEKFGNHPGREPPRVHIRESAPHVEVLGVYYGGTRDCNRTVVESLSYEQDTVELTVTDRDHRGPLDYLLNGLGCQASATLIPYRLELTVADGPPEQVTAIEASTETLQTHASR